MTPFIALVHDEAVSLIGSRGKGVPGRLRGNAGGPWRGNCPKGSVRKPLLQSCSSSLGNALHRDSANCENHLKLGNGGFMMNLNDNPTIDQLAKLFATRKDSLDDHLLWVSQSGEVRLDRLPPNTIEDEFQEHLPSMRARFKAYRRGQGYVGKKAAADTEFVGRVLQTLQQQWPEARTQHAVKVIEAQY